MPKLWDWNILDSGNSTFPMYHANLLQMFGLFWIRVPEGRQLHKFQRLYQAGSHTWLSTALLLAKKPAHWGFSWICEESILYKRISTIRACPVYVQFMIIATFFQAISWYCRIRYQFVCLYVWAVSVFSPSNLKLSLVWIWAISNWNRDYWKFWKQTAWLYLMVGYPKILVQSSMESSTCLSIHLSILSFLHPSKRLQISDYVLSF